MVEHDGKLILLDTRVNISISFYVLQVKAIDSGIPPRYSRTEVYVQILDENDNNPYFLSDPRVLMVPENTEVGQKIAVLEARDPDSGEFGKITYLLDRISSEVSSIVIYIHILKILISSMSFRENLV